MNMHQSEVGVFTKKQKRIMGLGIVFIVAIIITTAFMLTSQGKQIAKDEVESYLSELSYQTSYKVNQRMETNLNTLLNLKDELNIIDEDEKARIIDNTIYHSAYEEIGYIDSKGVFTSDDKQTDISNTNILKDLKNGNSNSISHELIKLDDGRKGVIYAVACNENGIALAGWIPTDTMVLLLNTDTFQGIGFSHIISRDGDYILKSQNKNAVLANGDNFFEELAKQSDNDYQHTITTMKDNVVNGKNGTIQYTVNNGEVRSLTYVPLARGNWYLLSIVPSNAYAHDINQFTTDAIVAVAGISIFLFSMLSAVILITSMKKNRIISNIAYVDPVTQGFTKSRFDQEIKKIMKNFKPFTYVVLDIRKFKLINDISGSKGGDEVLNYVYQCIAKYLDDDEFAARLQADYFELILNTTKKDIINEKLLAIAEEINKFNNTRENPYYLPIDCGIYVVDEVTDDLVIIRDRANSARKNNKEVNQTHLCSCVYYNDLERLQMVQEKEIDNAMEKALENEEFSVYLQPKVDISSNKVAGAEALIRWNSPTMGFLSPDKFIPYFEKTGFIVKLDEFVFEKVCQQIRRWLDEGKEAVPISVNLSRRDLYDKKYLERYKAIQEKYQVPSHLLEIEFTETLFFENYELLKQAIEEVHEAGYLCSIDDFGSGYSSLGLLKEIPVDILKLDKIFFDDISNTRGDKVVEHVIALAKDLNMLTIAEGVETVIQVEQLQKMKCDLIQGYVYYKPMTIDDFDKIVEHDYEIISISNQTDKKS